MGTLEVTKRLPGRPKDMAKRHAIVMAAEKHFLADGFERTSLDSIADTAGVSKLTVYSHFADKESLFNAIIAQKCEEVFALEPYTTWSELPPQEAMLGVAGRFLKLVNAPEMVSLLRAVIGEVNRNPRIGAMFYENGPARVKEWFSGFYERMVERGVFKPSRADLAFDHFASMLKGQPHLQMLLGLKPVPKPGDLEARAQYCADVFLRIYGQSERRLDS